MRVYSESDFYSALGVGPGADQDSLRQAYLRLARLHHPDRNPGDDLAEERFKLISQAYAILRDPSTRKAYDRLRRSKTKTRSAPKGRQAQSARRSAQSATGSGPDPFSTAGTSASASSAAKTSNTSSASSASSSTAADGAAKRAGPEKATGKFDQSSFSRRQGESAQSFDQAAFQAEADREKDSSFDFAHGHFQKQATANSGGRTARPERPRDKSAAFEDETINKLFKTAAARESIDKMQEELDSAGLGDGLERVLNQLKKTVSAVHFPGAVKSAAGKFLRRLRAGIHLNPLTAENQKAPEDIVLGLMLTAEAAGSGTVINLHFHRDDSPHHLTVKIPPGLSDHSRIRISGQGHLGKNGTRGDLFIDVDIKK
ncbi:MAG: DnaJ domain-containing protein [Deltaproteobacteria bacterium]|jgi:curved DNA-binding protein CbpA|nr:DnaJ domain-containing protein [Deltaproteobacteria bacterium]